MLNSDIGRRQFLHTVLSGAVLGAVSQAGLELASPRTLHAQTTLSPDEALHELLTGNQRFASNHLTSITHNLIIMKERTVNKQEPFAAVLACADSRIPVELVFDQTIGHIFVTASLLRRHGRRNPSPIACAPHRNTASHAARAAARPLA